MGRVKVEINRDNPWLSPSKTCPFMEATRPTVLPVVQQHGKWSQAESVVQPQAWRRCVLKEELSWEHVANGDSWAKGWMRTKKNI